MPRRLRLSLAAVFSTVLAVVGTVGVADAAQAATTYNTSSAYTVGWTLRSTDIKKCARVTVSGYVKGSWRYLYNNGDLNDLRWTNLQLVNPKVSVSSWGYTSTGCDSSKHWNMKVQITQAWYETTCTSGAIKDVAVSFPWGISATLAPPACGSSKAGNRTSTEGPSTAELTQSNPGSPIGFQDTDATVGARRGVPDGGLDFGGAFRIRIISSADGSAEFTKRTTVNLNK